MTLAPAAPGQTRRQVVIVEPVVDPFFYYPYPYYPTYAPAETTGYVKIDTQQKNARIYVDGGYAGVVAKLKKFPLPPGNHRIELRNSDGRTFYRQQVHVLLGKTTKIHVG